MSLTTKQINDLNNRNVASQNVKLGTLLDAIQQKTQKPYSVLTTKQIYDLNNQDVTSQKVELGKIVNALTVGDVSTISDLTTEQKKMISSIDVTFASANMGNFIQTEIDEQRQPIVTSYNLSADYLKTINDAGEDLSTFTTLKFSKTASDISGATEICSVGATVSDDIKAYKNGTNLIIYSTKTIKCFECYLEHEVIPDQEYLVCNLFNYMHEIVEPETYEEAKLENIANVYLDNFDTSEVVSLQSLFSNYAGTTIDVSELDTSSCEDMSYMFDGTNLTSITGLENLDTSNVTTMEGMFSNSTQGRSSNMTTIDCSNFDMSNVTSTMSMFYSRTTLTTIYVSSSNSDWTGQSVTDSSNMFGNCTSLPNFSSSETDISKAKLSTSGGYFTLKQ